MNRALDRGSKIRLEGAAVVRLKFIQSYSNLFKHDLAASLCFLENHGWVGGMLRNAICSLCAKAAQCASHSTKMYQGGFVALRPSWGSSKCGAIASSCAGPPRSIFFCRGFAQSWCVGLVVVIGLFFLLSFFEASGCAWGKPRGWQSFLEVVSGLDFKT